MPTASHAGFPACNPSFVTYQLSLLQSRGVMFFSFA